jgi:type IV secretory pathway VirB10-like protein
MNNRVILIFAVVVLAICVAAAWFLQLQPKTETPPQASVAPSTAPVRESAPVVPPPRPVPAKTSPAVQAPPKKADEPARPLAEWEVKIDQALRADIGETETAQLPHQHAPDASAGRAGGGRSTHLESSSRQGL